MRSLVITLLLAAAVGLGIVWVVSRATQPGGALFAATAPPKPGAPGASGVPAGAHEPVVKRDRLTLADGVTLDAFIVLGPRAEGAGDAGSRLLVATYEFRRGGFALQSAQTYVSVPGNDRGRRGTSVEFDVHLAGRAAATLLGASAEMAAPYAEPLKSPFYGCHLDPRAGLTWGEVAAPDDLVLSISQEP